MFDLTGKTALVTGGSRGLGRAIALAFARQGADVAINYRGNAEAADEVAAEISGLGRRAVTIQGDTAAGREAAEAIVKAALDGLGSVDILVNNAGITRDNLLMRMDGEEWDAVIDTNLSGPFWMTRAIARPMLKARSGRIINMSSAAGRMGNAGQANYAAAKAGLIGLTKTTARELASRGITCNAIAPGLITHRPHRRSARGRHRGADVADAARLRRLRRRRGRRRGLLRVRRGALRHRAGARRRRRHRDGVIGEGIPARRDYRNVSGRMSHAKREPARTRPPAWLSAPPAGNSPVSSRSALRMGTARQPFGPPLATT